MLGMNVPQGRHYAWNECSPGETDIVNQRDLNIILLYMYGRCKSPKGKLSCQSMLLNHLPATKLLIISCNITFLSCMYAFNEGPLFHTIEYLIKRPAHACGPVSFTS